MIDIREIYESVVAEARGQEKLKAMTVDGGTIMRECYSYGDPLKAAAAVEDTNNFAPIDLNHELKFVRKAKFDPAALGSEPLFARRPRRGCFGPIRFGDGVTAEVDYSREVRIFDGGLASVGFAMNGAFEEAYLNTMVAMDDLADFEEEKKAARKKAEDDWEAANPFDPDDAFPMSSAAAGRKEIRNKREAYIRKAMSQREKSRVSVGKHAEDEVARSRNMRLTGAGLYDSTVRRILAGSVDVDSLTIWWYPTVLDLARMFDQTVSVPAKVFLDIDDNDTLPPPADPEFSRDLIAESWESARTGEKLFQDIRDSRHTLPNAPGRGPFPDVKAKRWELMLDRYRDTVTTRPWDRVKDPMRGTYRNQDWTVTEGSTGRPVAWFETQSEGYDRSWNIMTVDGVRVIYDRPWHTPKTAFFMSPSNLAQAYREAKSALKNVSLNMIRRTFINLKALKAEADDMFAQKGGSRRWIL